MLPETLESLAALGERLKGLSPKGGRLAVALSGPPAVGKSTQAEALAEMLGPGARVVGMDGFHLDNRLLEARGLLKRKGAPETFDAAGFAVAAGRIAAGETVILPVFDRARDIAIAGAVEVGEDVKIAVFEGNYLAFDDPAWRGLADLWDLSVALDADIETLRARLVQRWLDNGHDQAAAEARAEGNDLANARRILTQRGRVDVLIRSE